MTSTALSLLLLTVAQTYWLVHTAIRAESVQTASAEQEHTESLSTASLQTASSHLAPVKPVASPAELRVPILVYHHIRPQQGWAKSTWSWKMTVSPTTFAKQMKWLRDRGYTTIDLDTLVAVMNGDEVGPTKPVVITFDDNQLNSYENGLPLLEQYGHIAVFYLVSNRLDHPDYIGRRHIPELLQKGMDIQSHTTTHANLTQLSAEQLQRQLTESKATLEAITGQPVRHVAYPLTAHNASVRQQVAATGYLSAAIMDPRPVTSGTNLFKLPRIMMTDETNLAEVLP